MKEIMLITILLTIGLTILAVVIEELRVKWNRRKFSK